MVPVLCGTGKVAEEIWVNTVSRLPPLLIRSSVTPDMTHLRQPDSSHRG
jgi:hypothetical protein